MSRAFWGIVGICIAAVPVTAIAGDPCPISVEVFDLGSPQWIDRDFTLRKLQSKEILIGVTWIAQVEGVEVVHIHSGTPAENSELRVNDVVIGANELTFTSAEEFGLFLDGVAPGETIDLVVMRNGEEADVMLTAGQTEPLTRPLLSAINNQECRSAQRANEALTETERANILELLFEENHAFRCKDAHVALEALGPKEDVQSNLYFVRGSRRVMIMMPYGQTVCIAAEKLDGQNLTEQSILKIIEPVMAGYVDDRFANP